MSVTEMLPDDDDNNNNEITPNINTGNTRTNTTLEDGIESTNNNTIISTTDSSIGSTNINDDADTDATATTTVTPSSTPATSEGNNNNNNNNNNNLSTASIVTTPYGPGTIIQQHRIEDGMMEIQLQYGARLYTPSSSHHSNSAVTSTDTYTPYDTFDISQQSSCCTSNNIDVDYHNDQSVVMELNVAYESLEMMRKLNLEMMCQEQHIPYTTQDLQTTCAVCLLAREPYKVVSSSSSSSSSVTTTTSTTEAPTPKRSFFTKKNTNTVNPIDTYNHNLTKKYSKAKVSMSCLICGTPTCPKHMSTSFRKENIIMCLTCEELFGLSYVIQILTCPNPKVRRQYIDKMIELYDRTILLLRFITTIQFDDICTELQHSMIRKNKVGIGSSSAGIVSGVLGIVSAATIFTPIGPPLLIASLIFGGSATAAQTGSHLRNSSIWSEPHRIADRIIALHGICWNILRVTGTLRDALLLDHLRTDLYTVDDNGHGVQHIMLTGTSQIATSPISEYYRTHQNEVLAKASNLGSMGTMGMVGITAASMEVGGGAVTAVESGVVAARSATFFSRGGTAAAALNALQFARFAGGTLAAATLVFEAHNLKNTIRAIQSGNPCEKVETIKRIRDQVRDIPSTQAVDAECERYLQALTRRQRVLTEQEVTNLLMETNDIIQEVQEIAAKQESNHSDHNENDDDDINNDALAASERSRESIRRRLTMFQRSQSSTSSNPDEQQQDVATSSSTISTYRPILSLRERIQMQKRQEQQRSNSPSTIRECNNEYDDDDARHAENLIC